MGWSGERHAQTFWEGLNQFTPSTRPIWVFLLHHFFPNTWSFHTLNFLHQTLFGGKQGFEVSTCWLLLLQLWVLSVVLKLWFSCISELPRELVKNEDFRAFHPENQFNREALFFISPSGDSNASGMGTTVPFFPQGLYPENLTLWVKAATP